MRTIRAYTTEKENIAAQIAAGRYHPAAVLLVTFDRRRHRLTLDAGNNDWLHVATEDGLLYVMNVNNRQGYAGLQIFDLTTDEEVGSLYCEAPETDLACRNFFERTDAAQLRALATRAHDLDLVNAYRNR